MSRLKLFFIQKGFSLPIVLAVAFALAFGVLSFSFLLVNASHQTAIVEARADIDSIRDSVQLVLSSPASCACQVDPSQNTPSASGLTVNTTVPSPADVILQELRLGCDFATASKMFLKINTPVPNSRAGLVPTAIKITGLSSVATATYSGTLAVSFSSPSASKGFSLTLPLQISVNPTAGTPSARPTQACAVASGGISSCPTGWTMVGTPSILGTFCVEQNLHPAASQFSAVTTCGQLAPAGFGRARLCDYASLYTACAVAGMSGIATGGGEWSDVYYALTGNYSGLIAGVGSCSGFSFTSLSTALPYRCCL